MMHNLIVQHRQQYLPSTQMLSELLVATDDKELLVCPLTGAVIQKQTQ